MNTVVLSAKFRTEGHPAPGKLVLVHGFLNTWSDELGIEDFKTASSTEAWMRDVGLWAGTRKITSKQHLRIISFRNELRAWLLDNKRVQSLNELAAEVTFLAEFCPSGEIRFSSGGDACDRILGTLIGVISESLQNGTWDRLKCCDLPTCGWAFYDPTRSRTKRWCSMKTCGSRHKSREYYKRSK